MDLRLDRTTGVPLYVQVAEGIRGPILSGALAAGSRLPATRLLAEQLGVHRNTVVAAYRQLEREGLLRSAVGAGTFVTGAVGSPVTGGTGTAGTRVPAFSWQNLLRGPSGTEADLMDSLREAEGAAGDRAILLNGALPDSRLFPMDEFRASMLEVLRGAGPQLLEYGPTEGYGPLRAWIAEWLADWGVADLSPDRVFVLNGSQQGLDLIARLVTRPGDRVLVEAPTYTGAHMVLREVGARLETIPIDGDGLVVDALEEALRREPARFLYLMPCYHNPTGVSLSETRRHQLLQVARERGLAILEDHYTSPLHYRGPAPRPLLADDPDGHVVHLGTFSKILFPGLRLGWLVMPPALHAPVRRLRWATDLSTGVFSQQILDRFCRSGRLARHLDRVRQLNAARLDAMLEALAEHFPREARWTRPQGGMTLWTELPEAVDTLELLREAAARGVLYTPGSAFYPNGGGRHAMRLSFNREEESRIRKGVRLLGEMIRTRLRAGKLGRRPARDAVPFV